MLFERTAPAPFPVRLEVDYPERLSRLSTFFRPILAIPLVIFAGLLAGGGFPGSGFDGERWAQRGAEFTVGALGSLVLAYWIAALLRGRPVRWLFDVIVAILRFSLRAYTYFLLLTDRYPPFEGEWSVRYEVDRPQHVSRWRVAIWKTVTVLPHLIVLAFAFIGVIVAVVIAWFAILFTGSYPEGLHSFVSGWLRWYGRAAAYWISLTDEFPSFSLSADAGAASATSYAASAAFGCLIVLASAGGLGALAAWPGKTTEVTVSYDQLLRGERSDPARFLDVELTLLEVEDPYTFLQEIYQPEDGRRFVLVHLLLVSNRRSGVRVETNDLRLKDSLGESHKPLLMSVGGQAPPQRIGKGGRTEIWAMYQLDENAKSAQLKYDPSYGFKRKVKFTLQ